MLNCTARGLKEMWQEMLLIFTLTSVGRDSKPEQESRERVRAASLTSFPTRV